MRGMQGNTTTTDLRLKAGLEDVQTQIIQRQARYIGHVARYKDTRIERVVLGIRSADKKEEGGLRSMYWKRVSEVMEQLRYPEHEWSEKWIEVARDRKSWKQGVSEVVKEYKKEFDHDTWENRHTEQNTSYEREVRQAIEELDDQGRACCPRCGGWQCNIRVHLSRCRPLEETPEGPRLRPREGSKSEKTQCGACGKWRVDMFSHKRFCRGLDEEPPGANQVRIEAAAPPPPPFSGPTEIRGKQSVPKEELRRERGEASPERRVADETGGKRA